jgi:hypothetical protein
VTFGGTASATFIVESSTSIVAVAPAHEAGVVSVRVVSPLGTSEDTYADDFTYLAVGRYEQSDWRVFYSGKWRVRRGAFSGGSYSYTSTKRSSVTVCFYGTQLDLIATKARTSGIASVSVDGGWPVSVDLYYPTTLPQQRVFGTGTLANGLHRVEITYARAKNRAARGYAINIDAMDIVGALVGNNRYQENDGRVVYAGSWWTAWNGSYSGWGSSIANSAGSVTIPFNGVRCSLIGTKSRGSGKAVVYIDGNYLGLIDLYNYRTRHNQVLWTSAFLPAGDHTVTIGWTGGKNRRSRGTSINVDAVEIVGSLRSLPSP